jgi:hypothetical protein
MLSSGMITHPFFIFPENFTHSIFGLENGSSRKGYMGRGKQKEDIWVGK